MRPDQGSLGKAIGDKSSNCISKNHLVGEGWNNLSDGAHHQQIVVFVRPGALEEMSYKGGQLAGSKTQSEQPLGNNQRQRDPTMGVASS